MAEISFASPAERMFADLKTQMGTAVVAEDGEPLHQILTSATWHALPLADRLDLLRRGLEEAFREHALARVQQLVNHLMPLAPFTDPVWLRLLHQPIYAGHEAGLDYLLTLTPWTDQRPDALAQAMEQAEPAMVDKLWHGCVLPTDDDSVLVSAVMMGQADWVKRAMEAGQGYRFHQDLWARLRAHYSATQTRGAIDEAMMRLPAALGRVLVERDPRWGQTTGEPLPRTRERWRTEDRLTQMAQHPASPASRPRRRA